MNLHYMGFRLTHNSSESWRLSSAKGPGFTRAPKSRTLPAHKKKKTLFFVFPNNLNTSDGWILYKFSKNKTKTPKNIFDIHQTIPLKLQKKYKNYKKHPTKKLGLKTKLKITLKLKLEENLSHFVANFK